MTVIIGFRRFVPAAGAIACWGAGPRGLLGTLDTTVSLAPRAISGLSRVEQLVTNRETGCALTRGQVWCWGRAGADAHAQPRGTTRPARVARLTHVRHLSAGPDDICAVRSDGRVVCFDGSPRAPGARTPLPDFDDIFVLETREHAADGGGRGAELAG